MRVSACAVHGSELAALSPIRRALLSADRVDRSVGVDDDGLQHGITAQARRPAMESVPAVRLARHQESALDVAEWLQTQSEIERVLFPALPDDPGNDLGKKQFGGGPGPFTMTRVSPPSCAAVGPRSVGKCHTVGCNVVTRVERWLESGAEDVFVRL